MKESTAVAKAAYMMTPMHLRRHGNSDFHLHPLHATFSLIAGLVLALLILLVLVPAAK